MAPARRATHKKREQQVTSATRRHAEPGRERGKILANLPSREVLLGLYRDMVLLRRFERAAQVACRKGETPGFLHLYIGQEATGVGVCSHLRRTDWVTSTHRGHGHALAKGADPAAMMKELLGRQGGCCEIGRAHV